MLKGFNCNDEPALGHRPPYKSSFLPSFLLRTEYWPHGGPKCLLHAHLSSLGPPVIQRKWIAQILERK